MEKIDFAPLELSGLTQADFAILLGVSRGAVNSWVRDGGGVHPLRRTKVVKYLAAIASATTDGELPLPKGTNGDIRQAAIKRILLEQLKKG